MNGATPETMAEARAIWRTYKAGEFWDQPHSCGHTRHLRAVLDKKHGLVPLTFDHWFSEFSYEANRPCNACERQALGLV